MKYTFSVLVAIAALSFGSVQAHAYNNAYSYGNGYGSGYNYSGYNYNPGYSYNNYNNPIYPPAPSPRTIPTVQVVYGNGYYHNNFVPTVRYFPPQQVYQPPMYQPPVYNPPYRPNPPSCFGHGLGAYCY